jgi:hypothetical protein
MRDKAQFPVVHCKMTETVMQASCGSGDSVGPWKVIEIEKLIPISPRDCLNMTESGKVNLFGHTVTLTRNGTGMRTLEERVNCDAQGRSPTRRSSGGPGRAHIQLTVRRVAIWRRIAVENIVKKAIVRGVHDIIPNYVAGGMDATEGTYVWDHIRRSCPGEEWEELYKGRLGILRNEVITLDQLVAKGHG